MMKMRWFKLAFCRNCGNAIPSDNSQSCPGCGVPADWIPTIPANDAPKSQQNKNKKKNGVFRVFIEVIALFAVGYLVTEKLRHFFRQAPKKLHVFWH